MGSWRGLGEEASQVLTPLPDVDHGANVGEIMRRTAADDRSWYVRGFF